MRIPEIRDELLEIAAATGNNRLAHLAHALTRRPTTRKAPTRSQRVTPELRREIAEYATANPDMSQVAVGRRFGVNPGRVSEALNGKRS
jgi:hypothetical protein